MGLKLNPSAKENKRYLLILANESKEEIKEKIERMIGIFEMAKTDFRFVKTKKDFFLVSVNREKINFVRAGLVFTNCPCIRVFGTIKKAEDYLKKRGLEETRERTKS